MVERPADRSCHARTGWRRSRAPRCPEDVGNQGRKGGQHPAGQALRRAVVRGQALPRAEAAGGGGQAGGQHADPAAPATARPAPDPRAAAAGPAPGRSDGRRHLAGQGSAGAAPPPEGDQAQGEGPDESMGQGWKRQAQWASSKGVNNFRNNLTL